MQRLAKETSSCPGVGVEGSLGAVVSAQSVVASASLGTEAGAEVRRSGLAQLLSIAR